MTDEKGNVKFNVHRRPFHEFCTINDMPHIVKMCVFEVAVVIHVMLHTIVYVQISFVHTYNNYVDIEFAE